MEATGLSQEINNIIAKFAKGLMKGKMQSIDWTPRSFQPQSMQVDPGASHVSQERPQTLDAEQTRQGNEGGRTEGRGQGDKASCFQDDDNYHLETSLGHHGIPQDHLGILQSHHGTQTFQYHSTAVDSAAPLDPQGVLQGQRSEFPDDDMQTYCGALYQYCQRSSLEEILWIDRMVPIVISKTSQQTFNESTGVLESCREMPLDKPGQPQVSHRDPEIDDGISTENIRPGNQQETFPDTAVIYPYLWEDSFLTIEPDSSFSDEDERVEDASEETDEWLSKSGSSTQSFSAVRRDYGNVWPNQQLQDDEHEDFKYEVKVPFSDKFPKEVVLAILQQKLSRTPPFRYLRTCADASTVFNVKTMSHMKAYEEPDSKIRLPDGSVSEVLGESLHPTFTLSQDMSTEKLRSVLHRRYNPHKKKLDLAGFFVGNDPQKLELDSKQENFRMDVMKRVLNLVGQDFPKMESLDLSYNEIRSLAGLFPLLSTTPKLAHLDLSGNKVERLNGLDILTKFPLKELVLKNNLLLMRFSRNSAYIRSIRAKFPDLVYLDDFRLLGDDDGSEVPTVKVVHKHTDKELCDWRGHPFYLQQFEKHQFPYYTPEMQFHIRMFYEKFFYLYDARKWEDLKNAYHAWGILTVNTAQHRRLAEDHQRDMTGCCDESEATRTIYIARGEDNIVMICSRYRSTKHIPPTLQVKVDKVIGDTLFLTVTGLFRENLQCSCCPVQRFKRSVQCHYGRDRGLVILKEIFVSKALYQKQDPASEEIIKCSMTSRCIAQHARSGDPHASSNSIEPAWPERSIAPGSKPEHARDELLSTSSRSVWSAQPQDSSTSRPYTECTAACIENSYAWETDKVAQFSGSQLSPFSRDNTEQTRCEVSHGHNAEFVSPQSESTATSGMDSGVARHQSSSLSSSHMSPRSQALAGTFECHAGEVSRAAPIRGKKSDVPTTRKKSVKREKPALPMERNELAVPMKKKRSAVSRKKRKPALPMAPSDTCQMCCALSPASACTLAPQHHH